MPSVTFASTLDGSGLRRIGGRRKGSGTGVAVGRMLVEGSATVELRDGNGSDVEVARGVERSSEMDGARLVGTTETVGRELALSVDSCRDDVDCTVLGVTKEAVAVMLCVINEVGRGSELEELATGMVLVGLGSTAVVDEAGVKTVLKTSVGTTVLENTVELTMEDAPASQKSGSRKDC